MTRSKSTTKPPKLPDLPYGDGSLHWNDRRKLVELQHKVDRRRFTERADTVAEAIAKRDERRVALGRPGVAATDVVTVADLIDDWLPFASSGKAASTIHGYRWAAAHVVGSSLGAVPLVELRPGHIERLLLDEVNAGTAKWSITKIRSMLKMALGHGVRNGYLATNPLTSAITPRGAVGPKDTPRFYEDDAATMITYLAEHHSTANAALLTILLCGLRPGEAAGLRWDSVRLRDGELDVRTSLRRMGTGNGDHVIDELKTSHLSDRATDDAARRTVEIPDVLARVLERERREQLARSGRSDYVFADRRGRHFSTWWLNDHARAAAKGAGLAYVPPNGYRHTFGSLLWNGVGGRPGMPATEVAALMGHRNAVMLTRTYGRRTSRRSNTSAYFGAMAR